MPTKQQTKKLPYAQMPKLKATPRESPSGQPHSRETRWDVPSVPAASLCSAPKFKSLSQSEPGFPRSLSSFLSKEPRRHVCPCGPAPAGWDTAPTAGRCLGTTCREEQGGSSPELRLGHSCPHALPASRAQLLSTPQGLSVPPFPPKSAPSLTRWRHPHFTRDPAGDFRGAKEHPRVRSLGRGRI